jgi:hypothetical protein
MPSPFDRGQKQAQGRTHGGYQQAEPRVEGAKCHQAESLSRAQPEPRLKPCHCASCPPATAARRRHILNRQSSRNLPEGEGATWIKPDQDWSESSRMRVGLLGPLGPSDGAFRRSTGSAPKTSQLHAARFRSRKRRFCSCGDHLCPYSHPCRASSLVLRRCISLPEALPRRIQTRALQTAGSRSSGRNCRNPARARHLRHERHHWRAY